MVAAHVNQLIADGYIGYCMGAFALGFSASLLITTFKKLMEKI